MVDGKDGRLSPPLWLHRWLVARIVLFVALTCVPAVAAFRPRISLLERAFYLAVVLVMLRFAVKAVRLRRRVLRQSDRPPQT
jgi:hypothetical protein